MAENPNVRFVGILSGRGVWDHPHDAGLLDSGRSPVCFFFQVWRQARRSRRYIEVTTSCSGSYCTFDSNEKDFSTQEDELSQEHDRPRRGARPTARVTDTGAADTDAAAGAAYGERPGPYSSQGGATTSPTAGTRVLSMRLELWSSSSSRRERHLVCSRRIAAAAVFMHGSTPASPQKAAVHRNPLEW